MSKPFIKLTVEEFVELVRHQYAFEREITGIHMHHTWRPNRANYAGLATINAMWEYHTQEKHWSDIAQHITIAPDGSIWTGRNWNRPPASATGFNGNAHSGPFMFEMIGDFDKGKDPFDGDQKETAIKVVATLLERFKLPSHSLRFHNHLTDEKTCPGNSIDYESFVKEVEKVRSEPADSPAGKKRRTTAGDEIPSASPAVALAVRALSDGMGVDLDLPEFRSDHLHGVSESYARSSNDLGSGLSFTPKAHLVNLRAGKLTVSGTFWTTTEDLKEMVNVHLSNALNAAKASRQPLRIVFYAHGGLGPEKKALASALEAIPWWRANHIYPIFFIWETGLMETLGQMIERKAASVWGKVTGAFGGERGIGEFIADHATDPAVERLARTIGGVSIWGGMKTSAEEASKKDTGGAWLLAEQMKAFLRKHRDENIELHAVGHSAGSIFHAHFMDTMIKALGGNKPVFKTLHHLAPAIRVDVFKKLVMPHLGKKIEKLTCYTMRDELERQDICSKAYNKSLLYLIHNGLEPEVGCPLVGLQRSIRSDAELKDLFEPQRAGSTEAVWSKSNGGIFYSSESTSHGGFDNDPATMNSVCGRILDSDDFIRFGRGPRSVSPDLIWNRVSDEQIAIGIFTERAMRAPNGASNGESLPYVKPSTPNLISSPNLRKRALCIGIDTYPDSRDQLSGCANDARNWQAMFDAQGFSHSLLLNEAATYEGIIASFHKLVEGTRPGDVVAIHYSGHGTHLPDIDGDEGGGDDEALCCHDFRTGKCIIDDEIGAAIDRVPLGVAIYLFMDCCHSGSNSRVAGPSAGSAIPAGAKRRFIEPDDQLLELHTQYRNRSASRKRSVAAKESDNPYAKAREVLFAAALPHQFAHEISGSGVFTSTVMRLLAQEASGLSNDGFMKSILRTFPASYKDLQRPELYAADASKSRAFLSSLI